MANEKSSSASLLNVSEAAMLATKRCLADLFLGCASYPDPRLCRDPALGVLAGARILGWWWSGCINLLGFWGTAATTAKRHHQGQGSKNGNECSHDAGDFPC